MLMTQSSSTAAVAAAPSANTPPVSTKHVSLILEITHGRTRFRERPVTGSRFLIGSGAACDLRLGESEMPALHSMIVIDGDEICLEAVARAPSLFINGRRQQSALLKEGDVIRLGAVEMVARISTSRAAKSAPADGLAADAGMADGAEQDLAGLSAFELIELIEQEEAEVEQFERQQRLGADALMDLVRTHQPRPAVHTILHSASAADEHGPHIKLGTPRRAVQAGLPGVRAAGGGPRGDEEFLSDLEEIGRALGHFSRELERRALSASEREANYASAATMLLETQQKLVSQVEQLLSQVEALRNAQALTISDSRTRAIA